MRARSMGKEETCELRIRTGAEQRGDGWYMFVEVDGTDGKKEFYRTSRPLATEDEALALAREMGNEVREEFAGTGRIVEDIEYPIT
jgi:hypothetical protein